MNFHDATLFSVHVDWVHKSAVVRLRAVGMHEPVEILASGVTDMRLPRQEPWGPSVSINSLHIAAEELTIEMQSGDTIVIAAQTFDLPRSEPPRPAALRYLTSGHSNVTRLSKNVEPSRAHTTTPS